ncbi:MAG: carbamoyltransferase HypF [Cyanobacteria bacterium SBLK]|nr:carbamoyltransferase HypF [Cyanobacteria bacterium SBLK]
MLVYPSTDSQSPPRAEPIAVEIRVTGRVQGVGFRPTVYRIATDCDLRGEVFNDGLGVLIRVAGNPEGIERFGIELRKQLPPLAAVEEIKERRVAIATIPQTDFQITPSQGGQSRTQISPDAATCPQCLADTLDPFSRFYRYPFTNCTHCGPRLSIVRQIPYDRQYTSMATFALCPDCQEEYDDPRDRRFHAQPVACHRCGPRAWLERADGRPVVADMFSMLDDVDAVGTLLQKGEIVAIKGIGGFHLACDATNEAVVTELRQRKHRYDKPFALMVRDLAVIEPYCEVSNEARALLQSPAAPIVLLPLRETRSADNRTLPIASSVAPGSQFLGVMLPYTPLHHLMLKRVKHPVVMTSGNRSDEPQCIDNEEAKAKLGEIATYFLFHNRDIVNRVDDSVVRANGGRVQVLRRARGYAPAPIALPSGFEESPPILAMGGELKNTFCLLRSGEAILSQHLGDLENAAALGAYQKTLALYQQIFEHQAVAIATDLHPEYLSTKLGQTLAREQNLFLLEIQHHHAHIAAVMAERGLPRESEPVLGIAFDGLGYGENGELWGGEFLIADYCTFERVAHLEPVAMLGGAQAMRQPWRNTYAQLAKALGWERLEQEFGNLSLVRFLAAKPRPLLDRMLDTGLRAPIASSAGRLFDAVAAAAGCCLESVSYEGQAAIALEALVSPDANLNGGYSFEYSRQNDRDILSAKSLWPQLLRDLQQGIDRATIAARFHGGFSEAIATVATRLARGRNLSRVVLSGGVWQNQVLLSRTTQRLQQQGFEVLTPQRIPANDGGLSLGQAAIAAARLLRADSP